MFARTMLVLALVVAAAVAAGSAASADSFGFFKTPSGKIVCQRGTDTGLFSLRWVTVSRIARW